MNVYDQKIKSAAEAVGNGYGGLPSAYDICISNKINSDYILEFKLPPKAPDWGLIEPERIVKAAGQLFRIRSPEDSRDTSGNLVTTVQAVHVSYDAERCKHIADFETINQTPKQILVSAFSGTHFEVVDVPGLEWVMERTDIEESRITPFAVCSKLIELVGGELYRDNWKIALVKQLGRPCSGVVFTDTKNLQGIRRKIDTSGLVTRLYPYGSDNLEIADINDHKPYIDSPYISSYAFPYVKDMDFNEIDVTDNDAKEQLKRLAEKQFEGPDRIDIPQITYTCDIISLHKLQGYQEAERYSIGDTVPVKDRLFGIDDEQRVVEVQSYIDSPEMDKVVIGSPAESLAGLLRDLNTAKTHFEQIQDVHGNVATSWLQMMLGNEATNINEDLANYPTAKYDYGALWTDENDPENMRAVAIIRGRLAIADGKDQAGEWNWTTVIDSGKVLVGSVFTGMLYTDLVTILSEDGTLTIHDNIIEMRDSRRIRFQAGNQNGTYIFKLYDQDGKETVDIDSSGRLTITGVFQTGRSGSARVEINKNGIACYNDGGALHGLRCDPGETKSELALYHKDSRVFRVRYTDAESAGVPGAGDVLQLFGPDGNTILLAWGANRTGLGSWQFDRITVNDSLTLGGRRVLTTADLPALNEGGNG